MPKFFVKEEQIEQEKITIIGEDVNHIKNVLRLKVDDDIEVCDTDTTKNYICGIKNINNDNIECIILKEKESEAESNIEIHIFQGLPKADKMELIIQKSIELGAKEIVPVEMDRCVVKLDSKSSIKKVERWQKISEVAAKQSGRDLIPKIKEVTNIKKICNLISNYDIVLLAYEGEKENFLKTELRNLKNKENLKIGIIIGPEGGITTEEVNYLKENGAKVITLGNRILRTETVALALTSIIMYELGDIGGKK
ncbi:MAG: 16S rRNA (uracil(1498)-N(3))-methyltransferase [Clostridia bacterium]|nr:16S rRNA (uracil(1498)-N(3))-methyltransferase [Clostridia bacterium]